jgi:lipoprotein-anchoring transpeptidase ErfK/SrfK
MRPGRLVTAKTAVPVGHDRCRRGWYEIAETGGFVCDGREVTAFDGDAVPDRAHMLPSRGRPLPYRYGHSRGRDTPMYKRLPTEEEALFWEDGVMPADAGMPVSTVAELEGDADGGVAEKRAPSTLAELSGERGALVRRRLNAGFFFALDREFDTAHRRYWRTMSAGYVPHKRVQLVEGSSFHGVTLADGPHAAVPPTSSEDPRDGGVGDRERAIAHGPPLHLPIAFVAHPKAGYAWTLNSGGRLQHADELPYHAVYEVVGRAAVGKRELLRFANGQLAQPKDMTVVVPTAPPARIKGEQTRWLDIDLTAQTLVAYEGKRPVFATLVSTGRLRNERNPALNSETPTGLFRILSKHVSTTMDGDHAVFGAYSLEDVPWVQFFQGAFALHGAFWHDKFGRTASHGCINLAPDDARWLFDWTSPEVPEAFHAAYPRRGAAGTWLQIRGKTPRG